MYDRLSAIRGNIMHASCTVLTLIGPRRHRELVHRLCHARHPAGAVIDVSSPTDAVLTLLTQPVDMVLIDVSLAGDLMPTLARHVRRSAPNARLAVFGGPATPAAETGTARVAEVLPWARLESILHGFLQAG